ncbi:MAG: ATP-binding protein [Planctomycetota bacterium]|nr:ATP-binding protein [Planctomycetota bacterium]
MVVVTVPRSTEAPDTACRSSSVLDAVLAGIVAVDREGRVTLLNPAAERLLEVRAMTTIGRCLGELIGDGHDGELLAAVREDLDRVTPDRPIERVVEIHPNGSLELRYVRLRSRCLKDHLRAPAGAVFEVLDVTDEHKTNQLKNQFLSIVAHELRTPLTGIKTFSTMLAKGMLGGLEERQQTVVESIREQSLRLEHQIDKLVNLGHIDAEEYSQDLDAIDAVEVVRQALGGFEVTARDRAITLRASLPDGTRIVRADRSDLRRAVQALVENALKFTRDGGSVAVTLQDSEPGRVEIAVADDGVGIEPRYQGRIFEKFFQVEDPLTRHHGGSGLGLFFVKNIVEAHGASVRVDSALGHGARFSFELQLDGTGETITPQSTGAQTAPAHPTTDDR